MEKDCTFAPQINKTEADISLTSSSIVTQMQKSAASKAVSKRLYHHAEMQHKRQKDLEIRRDRGELNTECTFEPQTNPNRDVRPRSAGYRSNLSRTRNNNGQNPDTGYTRSMVLYENYYRLEDRKKKLKEDEEIRLRYEQRDPKRKNLKSETIIQQKKEQILSCIFDCLDGDKDNCISINAINIEAVPRDISRIIMPIVQELEDLEEGFGAIDKAEFLQASLRLYTVSYSKYYTSIHLNCSCG